MLGIWAVKGALSIVSVSANRPPAGRSWRKRPAQMMLRMWSPERQSERFPKAGRCKQAGGAPHSQFLPVCLSVGISESVSFAAFCGGVASRQSSYCIVPREMNGHRGVLEILPAPFVKSVSACAARGCACRLD